MVLLSLSMLTVGIRSLLCCYSACVFFRILAGCWHSLIAVTWRLCYSKLMDTPSVSKRPVEPDTVLSPKRSKPDEESDESDQSVSTLESLPTELMWMIIDCTRDSIHNLRMV